MPAYCCWDGVLCCHEHSIYTDARRVPCTQGSVSMLQLRAGNLTREFQRVMPQLETLHRYGLLGLDLSRNYINGSLPAAIGNLTNLQVLLLGANSECIEAAQQKGCG